ncbi:MAG TPA: PAS domain S-box protein, partial [Proteobacteria bacterium]|nr:PAS domain S-box protein [Pseudomonadota bacterium]
MVAGIFLLSLIAGWLLSSLGSRGAILALPGMLLLMIGLHLLLLFQGLLWLDLWPLLSVILLNYLGVTARKLGLLFHSLDDEIESLSQIQKFAPPLPQSPDEEKLFRTFFTFLSSLLKIDTALLLLFNGGGKKLIVRYSDGNPDPAQAGIRISPPPELDDLNDPCHLNCGGKGHPFPWYKDHPQICLILPLIVEDRRLGFLVIGRGQETTFSASEIETGKMIAYHLGYALQKLAAYSHALGPVGSSIHFFHPGGMGRKIENLNILSRAMTYEQILLVSMLGSITDGVIVSDLLGNILLVNPRAREILHLPEEEARDLNIIKFLMGLLNLNREEFLSRFHHLLAEREAFTREVTISSKTYLLSLTSFRREDGIPGGIMAVFTDISYLKELDKLRAETMAMLTHEIKNPLSGVMGFCELFVKGILEPEETTEYIHLIRDSVTGLHKLVIEYLAAARLESGAVELKLDPVDLATIIKEEISLLTPRAQEQEIRIEKDLPDLLPEIEGDADMLRRVCGNLIGNAIQYSPSGTEITVSLALRGDRIIMKVSDQGYGIPPEEREKIFQKFFRGKRTERISGTGLGLAITKEIVKRHGGSIRVEEREGGGSVFIVEFKTRIKD